MASGDRGPNQPEIGEIGFAQIRIAGPDPSKQRVVGSIPIARSRYDCLTRRPPHSGLFRGSRGPSPIWLVLCGLISDTKS